MSYIHPFQSILVCWFLKCQSLLLPSHVWPLPICLGSWTWHSRFLCNTALWSIRPITPTTSHIHSWVLFLLWFHLFILSGVISPLISSNILGTYWPGEFIFQCPIFLPFHTVHGVLKTRILKWFAIPPPVDHVLSELCELLPQDIGVERCMCAHLLLRELQNYNSLLNNHWQENVASHQKKIPHVKGHRRSPSTMAGGVKLHLESNPIPAKDAWRNQTNLMCTRTQGPHRDWARTTFECLLWRYETAVACCRIGGSGCSRAGYCISPLGGGSH